MTTHAIILAAGKGTRMRSERPKVLHEVIDKPMLRWVTDAVGDAGIVRRVVVAGHQSEDVIAALPDGVESVVQQPQLGTGHAVVVALEHLDGIDPEDTVLVCYGDHPLVPADRYRELAERSSGNAVVLTTVDPTPTSFGRVIRDNGEIVGIVEKDDATPEQAAISEGNAGMYAFRAADLIEALSGLDDHNAQGELYLTDTVGILAAQGRPVSSVAADPIEMLGVNSQSELAVTTRHLRERINGALMDSGVIIDDPDRTQVGSDVIVEPGAILRPGVYLRGRSRVSAGAQVGPDVTCIDSSIGRNSLVWYSVLRGATVGADCEVGPYASLRPEAVLEDGSKAGTFVEIKKSTIGPGAKVPHLSYIGDATIGADANIGAGTITCNYDGIAKHKTEIGKNAFIGSDTMLVAPVKIGDGAVTGAGSVITEDVEAEALSLERSPQKHIPGYARKRKANKSSED
ncbi:MAG: UDP-N-acetylglucosamine diphosphorylase/glucosamine-1-phosphate N-acetyltransferase [Acidimicrobiia bacterium]|nr:UDP-N-acetylglucosamine diphosphorylase/glucosamine-1-phosphate N-acetyltransferase [Acidimicrobiia bacterium]